MSHITPRIRTTLDWELLNPILDNGEPGIERTIDGNELLKMGDGVTAWVDLEYYTPEYPGKHKNTHAFGNTDALSLADITSALSGALPSLGTSEKLATNASLSQSNYYSAISYPVGTTLTPENNIHYVLSGDITILPPTIQSGIYWKATVLIPAGALVTLPDTWLISGVRNASVKTVLFLVAADGVTIHAEYVAYGTDPVAGTSSPTPIIYVDSGGNDANDGLTWLTAKQTVDAGATLARSLSGELWIKTGTYSAIDDYGFDLTGLTVYGGFAGTETSVSERSKSAPGGNGRGASTYTNATILRNRAVDRAGSVTVLKSGDLRTSIINGITIRDSKGVAYRGYSFVDCLITANSTSGASYIVLFCELYNCTLSSNNGGNGGAAHSCIGRSCIFQSNTAGSSGTAEGGGAYRGSYYDTTFTQNLATQGGGVHSVTCTYCTISTNTASNVGGGARSSILVNCILTSNQSYHGGGGYDCTAVGCTFTSNNSTTSSGYGGGLCNSSAYDCVFITNTGYRGGGIACSGSGLTYRVDRCIFIGNISTNSTGPGIYYDVQQLPVTNCIFAGHGAVGGTTVRVVYNTNTLVYNCTFIHNSLFTQSTQYFNCLTWRNGAEDGSGAYNHCTAASGVVLGSFVAPVDIAAGVPASLTALQNAVLAHGYDLAVGAVAIGFGSNLNNLSLQDLRKRTRVVGTIDCGAYEYQG